MRYLAAITIVVAVALAGLLGGVARESLSAAEARPAGAHSLTLLGFTHAQRARETGDAAYVTRAAAAFRRALKLAPTDVDTLTGLGGVALARHRFREALVLGRRARAAAPSAAAPNGVIGDALVELGRYDAAFAAFDRMAALKPNTASYSRVAYARELIGDVAGAVESMELALDAATGNNEAFAWTAVELGKLHWSVGRAGRAETEYLRALATRPGYAPALHQLAQVEAARGRLGRAIRLQRRAADAAPLPHLVAQLADLLELAGRGSEALEQRSLIAAIERLQAGSGYRIDLETALYRTDRGIRLDETLALARAARAARPSIHGDDVLAWALARNGRCAEAKGYAERSLRLGTHDATLFFHRGMIERCLGNDGEARTWFRRALALNEHFSLRWSPVARRAAA